MTYNFLCNTASLPGVHERLIFVTLDTVARDELKRTWPDIRQFHWPTPSLYVSPVQSFFTIQFFAFLGKSFWMMQQDTFWRKNLFELGFEDNTSYDAIFDQLGVDEKTTYFYVFYFILCTKKLQTFLLCNLFHVFSNLYNYRLAHSWEWMYSEQKNPPYIMQLDCETGKEAFRYVFVFFLENESLFETFLVFCEAQLYL
ncbi:unnamed protein product [Cylicostephanus goldi]|uniref:Nucleotide-diphospho-sugar transferase domain-containing protein n=1 Tax=Cylicostephanus goldi TaxID=71465 RepID=A0A3P6QA55_CYLGO|nr:unnamed protein product [Cylicostephanus goldi]